MNAKERTRLLSVWVKETALEVGRSAPLIVERMLIDLCPKTWEWSRKEGVDASVRSGLVKTVKDYLKDKSDRNAQLDFAEISEQFGAHVVEILKRFSSLSHFVPSAGEYVPLRELMNDQAQLDEARKFKRVKGEETMEEANNLDQLYEALFGAAE
ncbi:MAG TPA: hypothetical protein VG758_21195 [Hyphomicrobiaceae bacterium]|jgi:hypothetical protein|nr:hypothetical protein [Hyphomicrobiaceae bacterium]